MDIIYNSIGVIHTPYIDMAPFQAVEDDTSGPFVLELEERYTSALKDLEKHKYLIVFFHIDRAEGYNGSNIAHPPSMNGASIGLFASRSPNRPNAIGIDVARLMRIEGNRVYTSGLSALDGTPLLDIKPYISVDRKELD
ncbi:MAG: tRNA (N6-threonylcarbamoyladenosine(37)-N6)-methyltransferase TrmO [Candidatus Sabulitectum sp.]|nr:tRNA (N6-threonylcarbamoyladenosine(37)-N6)-methyltransferase TrmO [Candidatus Sabulitectum sp.]